MTAVEIIDQDKPRGRAVAATPSPMDVVVAAMKSGNVEMYREAVALMKDMDAFSARKAFNNALADAKAKLPILKKNRVVDYANSKGDRTTYKHEDLAEVVRTVVPILSEFGLSHRYRLAGKPGEAVTVTCILSHRDGHAEENTLSAGADTSGGKNPIQGIKSTVTYLERITLAASLGLAAAEDDDGRSSNTPADPVDYVAPPGCITQDQADQIIDALESGGVSRTAFLQWARQTRIENVPADHFDSCIQAISNITKGKK